MIRRERDASFLNRIVNSSTVKPFVNYCVHGDDVDLTPALPHVVFLSNGEDAFASFEQLEPKRWQGHTFFGATCHGRRAIDLGKEMLAYILPRFGDSVWGATAIENRKARWFNRQIGMKSIGYDSYPVEGLVELFEVRA